MYSIYADDKLLHDPRLFDEGCGVLSPKLTVELNKAGSLNYTFPPNNLHYDQIKKLKSVVVAYQNGKQIFRGRVLNDEKDFYKQKKIYCEGQLAFLLDSIVRPYEYSGTVDGLFRQLVQNHNSRVEPEKQFRVGKVSITDKIACENSGYPNTFDEITSQILNVFGGNLLVRDVNGIQYLDLVSSSIEDGNVNICSQVIEFGVNMLDLTEHITAENIYTVLIPLGGSVDTSEEGSEETTNKKVTINVDGKDYIENTTAIQLFGRIEKTITYDDITDEQELYQVALNDLNKNIEMATTLNLRAIDLNLLDVNTDVIHVGDWVQVISPPHGINRPFQCTKISYDLASPDLNEYTFGASFTTLTDKQVNDKKSMDSSVSTVLSTANSVNATVSKVNGIVSQLPTDYVSDSEFTNYQNTVTTDLNGLIRRIEILESKPGGGTVDLTPLTNRVTNLETRVGTLETNTPTEITTATVNGLWQEVFGS